MKKISFCQINSPFILFKFAHYLSFSNSNHSDHFGILIQLVDGFYFTARARVPYLCITNFLFQSDFNFRTCRLLFCVSAHLCADFAVNDFFDN